MWILTESFAFNIFFDFKIVLFICYYPTLQGNPLTKSFTYTIVAGQRVGNIIQKRSSSQIYSCKFVNFYRKGFHKELLGWLLLTSGNVLDVLFRIYGNVLEYCFEYMFRTSTNVFWRFTGLLVGKYSKTTLVV